MFYLLEPPTKFLMNPIITKNVLDKENFKFFARENKRKNEILLNLAICFHIKSAKFMFYDFFFFLGIHQISECIGI